MTVAAIDVRNEVSTHTTVFGMLKLVKKYPSKKPVVIFQAFFRCCVKVSSIKVKLTRNLYTFVAAKAQQLNGVLY